MMQKTILSAFIILLSVFCYSQEFKDLAQNVIDKDTTGIDKLLLSGMNINTQDPASGVTILMIASAYPHYKDMVEFLLSRNADVNISSTEGKTALSYAVSASAENVKLLISKGANVNVKANDGMTPFFQSVLSVLSNKVTTEVCDILIKNGAQINATLTSKSGSGWTALHFASFEGSLDVVNYLIRHGANVNAVSDDGASVLSLAKDGKFTDVVTALRKAGARD